jgi:hypothetical protein
MIAVKAQYNHGHIVFPEPIPADIDTAELNIIVIPSVKNPAAVFPADVYRVRQISGEEEFKQIGLASFFDTDDDANVDWEDYFGVK